MKKNNTSLKKNYQNFWQRLLLFPLIIITGTIIISFAFSAYGSEDRDFGQIGDSSGGFMGFDLLTDEDAEALYKKVVENKCHTPAYPLDKPFEEVQKEYKAKQQGALKSAIVGGANERLKIMESQRKKTGSKEPLREKLPKDPSVKPQHDFMAQSRKQSKTPAGNGYKTRCKSRNGEPTFASNKYSSCKFAEVTTNNFCAYTFYLKMRQSRGKAMHAEYCKKYPKDCASGGVIPRAKWDEFLAEERSRYAEAYRTAESSLREMNRQFMDKEVEDYKAMAEQIKNLALERERQQQEQLAEAESKQSEKHQNAGTSKQYSTIEG